MQILLIDANTVAVIVAVVQMLEVSTRYPSQNTRTLNRCQNIHHSLMLMCLRSCRMIKVPMFVKLKPPAGFNVVADLCKSYICKIVIKIYI